jgi:hypothetical protein
VTFRPRLGRRRREQLGEAGRTFQRKEEAWATALWLKSTHGLLQN